ncbi:MAG: hypothetical protein JWO84_454 [Parcubacteria group bacterium]|nr:hypothetical protein [Parcubacteria group bacterium]
MKQPKPFSLNDAVTWKAARDQNYRVREYARAFRTHEKGPFTVEALVMRNVWCLVLKDANGTLFDPEKTPALLRTPALFPACWFERVYTE